MRTWTPRSRSTSAVAGKDEGGFAEVGLAGDGLHLVGGEAARIGEDGESVAFERVFGEDITWAKSYAQWAVGGAVSKVAVEDDLTWRLLRRMFSIDRNGANCFMLARLAAVQKISHDDDAEHDHPPCCCCCMPAWVGG